MKTCPSCHRLFPDDSGFCPIDGQALRPTAEVELPSDPEDPRVGATLCSGRYQIWRRVADGGMGRVYQALDLREGRSVALKILHAEVAQDAVAVERFKREFEFSKALPHTYIVEVFDFEHTEDQSFALVMEYLEGEELRTLLKREKVLRPERVIRMMSQVAIGLTAAHERHIVHRDLKPDNIFLCGSRDGDLCKILDFGSVRDNSAGAKKLTVLGTTIGSPFYMSPEQAQALEALDHRADVWSMAAITYECLTGTLPFRATTGPAILLAILSSDPEPPSVAGKAHEVPATLDPVIEEAMAKSAAIRTPTMDALAERLGHAYGLCGRPVDWAQRPQHVLRQEVYAGLPVALASYVAKAPLPATALKGMDDAFKDDPEASAFAEDMIMGVPTSAPKWTYAAVAVGALLVGAVIVLLAMR